MHDRYNDIDAEWGDGGGMTSVVCLKPWPGLKDSLDIFPIQIEQEIKK